MASLTLQPCEVCRKDTIESRLEYDDQGEATGRAYPLCKRHATGFDNGESIDDMVRAMIQADNLRRASKC